MRLYILYYKDLITRPNIMETIYCRYIACIYLYIDNTESLYILGLHIIGSKDRVSDGVAIYICTYLYYLLLIKLYCRIL